MMIEPDMEAFPAVANRDELPLKLQGVTIANRVEDLDRGTAQLRLLARALGRQAARSHLHRGYSTTEVALGLAAGALVIVAFWYLGLLPPLRGSR